MTLDWSSARSDWIIPTKATDTDTTKTCLATNPQISNTGALFHFSDLLWFISFQWSQQ